MSVKSIFYDVASGRRGVKPLFEPAHVLKALLLLYEKEPMGRNLLSKMLGIGIASTRTLIKRLKEYDLINIDNVGGCLLTEKGKNIVTKVRKVIRKIENVSSIIAKDLKLGSYSWIAVIENGIELVNKYGIVAIRDRLVGYGARAALIIFVEDFTYIPPDKSLNESKYHTLKCLKEFLSLRIGDALIVSFSDDPLTAEKALLNTIIDIFLDIPM
ncbi:MAG: DUF4443 domain-containing protein [Ignisphaera sp.]